MSPTALNGFIAIFDSSLRQELDFRIEGHNRERLAAIIERSGRSKRSAYADVLFPKVFWEYTHEDVMVQEFVEGAVFLGSKEQVEGHTRS